MRMMRYSMMAASLLLILTGVVVSGINFVDGLTLKQDSLAAQKKARFYADRYEMAREHLPQTPVEAAELKVAVDIINELKKYRTSPIQIVRVIGSGLNQYPDLVLNKVEWMANNDPNFGSGGSGSNPGQMLTMNTAMPLVPDGRYYQIAILEGQISGFEGDYRSAIATVNAFTETLRNQESVFNVSVLDFPLDISSSASLQGNTQTIVKEANFTIRVVLGVKNEV